MLNRGMHRKRIDEQEEEICRKMQMRVGRGRFHDSSKHFMISYHNLSDCCFTSHYGQELIGHCRLLIGVKMKYNKAKN